MYTYIFYPFYKITIDSVNFVIVDIYYIFFGVLLCTVTMGYGNDLLKWFGFLGNYVGTGLFLGKARLHFSMSLCIFCYFSI